MRWTTIAIIKITFWVIVTIITESIPYPMVFTTFRRVSSSLQFWCVSQNAFYVELEKQELKFRFDLRKNSYTFGLLLDNTYHEQMQVQVLLLGITSCLKLFFRKATEQYSKLDRQSFFSGLWLSTHQQMALGFTLPQTIFGWIPHGQ